MANGGGKDVKVSREGIVLIKSFEGFRPRAERLADGRWVIGYGHTRSAREGATVGEGDAELLLQYDLIPVVAAIRDRVAAPLNQHQIDALASYALSVGVDAFATSPIVAMLNTGQSNQAGAALSRAFDPAPDHAPGDPLARRRAAEGALFTHAADRPVALASLLTAPAVHAPPPSAPDVSPPPAQPTARAEALAHLLGEPATPLAPVLTAQPETSTPEAANDPSPPVPETPQQAASTETLPDQTDPVDTPAPVDPAGAARSWRSGADLTVQRYSSYAQPALGPLPFGPIRLAEPVLPTVSTAAPTGVDPEPQIESPSASEPAVEPNFAPAAPMVEPAAIEVEAMIPIEPDASAPVVTPDLSLVLTPPPEVELDIAPREVWPEARRHPAQDGDEGAALFDDDMSALPGLQVLRSEVFEPDAKPRFDWSETGAFLGMGGVGLAAFGASIAGFRLAQDQVAAEAFNQTTLVSWVLALIGALCVGVSAFNLYLRWGRRSDD